MSSTSQLLEGTRQASPHVSDLLNYASAAAFVMLNGDGHIDTAHRLLVGAIEGRAHRWDAGDTALINALWTLALLCFCGGRRELWDPFYAALARLSPGPPPDLALTIDMFADPARTGTAALPRLEAALRTVHHEVEPGFGSRTSRRPRFTRTVCGGLWPLRPLWARLVAIRRNAERRPGEENADRSSLVLPTTGAAGRRPGPVRDQPGAGRPDDRLGRAARVRTAQVFARHALVLADLGRGDFESAYHHATAMSPAGALASHVPHCLWVVMDLVEAAVRTRRHEEADRHVRAVQEADLAGLSPRLANRDGAGARLPDPRELQIARLAALGPGPDKQDRAAALRVSADRAAAISTRLLPQAGHRRREPHSADALGTAVQLVTHAPRPLFSGQQPIGRASAEPRRGRSPAARSAAALWPRSP